MRVVHVIHSLDPRTGGTASALRELAAGTVAAGIPTEAACLDAPGAPWLVRQGVPVRTFPARLRRHGWSPELRAWLRGLAPDTVVVAHGVWQEPSLAAASSGRPAVVFPHGMLDPYFRRVSRLRALLKGVYWRVLEGPALARAARVAFTTEEERRRAHGGFRPWRLREAVVPLGVREPPAPEADAPERLRRLLGPLAGRRYVLHLGRVHPKKGVDLLLGAFLETAPPEAALVIAGPGGDPAYADALRRRAAASDRRADIAFVPRVEGADLWALLRGADLFALISHQENFAFAAVEALAAGTPVVLSRDVAVWREADDDGAGLSCDADAAGARGALRAWFALDPASRSARRDAARRCYEARFRLQTSHRALLACLEDVLREHRAA